MGNITRKPVYYYSTTSGTSTSEAVWKQLLFEPNTISLSYENFTTSSNDSFKLETKPCMVKVDFDSLIDKVIFNGPATIVKWKDGSKTVVKCMDGDIYDEEKALMMCIMEKLIGGSKGDVKRFFDRYIPEEDIDIREITKNTFDTITDGLEHISNSLKKLGEKKDD